MIPARRTIQSSTKQSKKSKHQQRMLPMPRSMDIVVVMFLLAMLSACPGVLVHSFQLSSSKPSNPSSSSSSFANIDTRRPYSSAAGTGAGMDLPLSSAAAASAAAAASSAASSDPVSTAAAAKNERMRQLVQNSSNHRSTLQQQQREATKKASLSTTSTSITSTSTAGQTRAFPEAAPHVTEVSTLTEFKKVVIDVDVDVDVDDNDSGHSDRVTAVRFYAPWCRSCRAIEGRFYRLGRAAATTAAAAAAAATGGTAPCPFPNVKFVQVAVGPDNAALHQGLGVTALPYAHIYHATARTGGCGGAAGELVEELRLTSQRFGDFEQILQSYNSGYCALPDTVDPDTGVYEAPYSRS